MFQVSWYQLVVIGISWMFLLLLMCGLETGSSRWSHRSMDVSNRHGCTYLICRTWRILQMIINYRYVLQPKNHLKWEWFCCRLLPLWPFRVFDKRTAGCTTSSSSRHWTMQRSGGQLGRRTGWIQCQTVPSSDWTDLKIDLINPKVSPCDNPKRCGHAVRLLC